MSALAQKLWARRMIWLPLVVLLAVLLAAFLLLPADKAPFIYKFF